MSNERLWVFVEVLDQRMEDDELVLTLAISSTPGLRQEDVVRILGRAAISMSGIEG